MKNRNEELEVQKRFSDLVSQNYDQSTSNANFGDKSLCSVKVKATIVAKLVIADSLYKVYSYETFDKKEGKDLHYYWAYRTGWADPYLYTEAPDQKPDHSWHRNLNPGKSFAIYIDPHKPENHRTESKNFDLLDHAARLLAKQDTPL